MRSWSRSQRIWRRRHPRICVRRRSRSGSSQAASAGARGWIVKTTLPRESIFLVQTPQAFRRAVLRDALALKDDATDEASLAERAGHVVRLVEGDIANIKITTADDLPIAEAIAV